MYDLIYTCKLSINIHDENINYLGKIYSYLKNDLQLLKIIDRIIIKINPDFERL